MAFTGILLPYTVQVLAVVMFPHMINYAAYCSGLKRRWDEASTWAVFSSLGIGISLCTPLLVRLWKASNHRVLLVAAILVLTMGHLVAVSLVGLVVYLGYGGVFP